MGTASTVVAPRGPGTGPGWSKVATAVAQAMPTEEIERLWVFAPVRQEDREWGTAVIARRGEGERQRVYTAGYMLVVRGRDRGQSRVAVEEVGESPGTVIEEVIRGVRERAAEAEPPVEIAVSVWFEAEPVPGDDPPVSPGEPEQAPQSLPHEDASP